MADLLLPARLGQQPDSPALNRDHPIGAKLKHLYVPGISPANLGAGGQLSAQPGAFDSRAYGRAATYTSTNVASQTVNGESAYPFVLVWVGRFASTTGNYAGITVARSGGSGDYHAIQVGSSSQIRYITRNNFSTTDTLLLAVPGGAVAGVDLVVVAQSLSATDHRVYCNGVMATSSTNSGTPAGAFNTVQLAISTQCNQNTYLAGWGTRALSDAEALAFSASRTNVWGLVSPGRSLQLVNEAAGGAANLVVQDAAHAHSADSLTLSTDSFLAAQDATHAHTANSLGLTTSTALVIAEAIHAHAAEGLALTMDSVLSVADALHAHAADNLTLTADGAVDLVIQDALHAHTADELTLTVTGAGGYYDDDPKRAPPKRKPEKLTVIHPDTSEQREAEFEALLQRVKGQALDKAKSAAQAAPAAAPSEIKPPRMPEIRGVEAAALRQWMPDLLSTYREQYRAAYVAELQALASAQQAAAQAQWARQIDEDEEIALLAMLA